MLKDDEEAFQHRQKIGKKVDDGLDDIYNRLCTSEPRALKSIIRRTSDALFGQLMSTACLNQDVISNHRRKSKN